MSEMRILSKYFIDGFYSVVNPIGRFLESANVHPHVVTFAGLLFSIWSGLLFWKGYIFWGGVILITAGACDVLDGRLARNTQRISRFGGMLDSTVDRYSEVAVFMGLAAFFHNAFMAAVIIMAIAGSLLTSYVRARAEGLGVECKIGLMQRPERITFISTGAIIGSLFDLIFSTHQPLLILALIGIAVLSNITVLQRIKLVNDFLKKEADQ